jgi:hypothetical protein
MNKSQAIWLFLIALFASAEACVNHESDKPAPTPTASRIVSPAPTRISVATANAYIKIITAKGKMVRAIDEKWDADSNAASGLEELKQIAIAEGPALDLAVQYEKEIVDLMAIVTASFLTPCNKSTSIITEMANESLAIDVEKNNLVIQSDISTAAGKARLRRANALLDAREQVLVDKKNALEESAEYKNACGPDD